MTALPKVVASGNEGALDPVVEIERLAALEPIDYEAARADAAKRLGVRATVLDREVAKKRRELGLQEIQDDPGQGRAVKIADILPWPDPVDGDFVATSLAAAIKTYAVLPDVAADTIALWILQTWLLDNFYIAPRLAITSPTKGCGKTTVLRLLCKLTRRPLKSGSISPAALFRAIEQLQPTLILDENEKYLEPGSDLHALLNEGHCRADGNVLRVLGEKQELRLFNTFGAVAFARNGRIPDDLELRSIVIEMQRRRPDESLSELRDDRCEHLKNLARMCARFADDCHIGDYDPDMGGLINRVADNWRPLFAIADVIGFDWPKRIREACAGLAPREGESTGPMALADIRTTFDEKAVDRLACLDLCEALAAIEGRPWAEWGRSNKPITPNQLARLLKPFGVIPGNLRIGGRIVKGYYRHQFEALWDRYPAAEGVYEPLQRYNTDGIGISNSIQNATVQAGVADEKSQKAPTNGHCSGVAVAAVGYNDGDSARPCDYCGRPGNLTEVGFGDVTAWLHRDCRNAWRADQDKSGVQVVSRHPMHPNGGGL